MKENGGNKVGNISERCKQTKRYLQSYVVMSSSIKVIENIINIFKNEQSQYHEIIESKDISEKIDMAVDKLISNLLKILDEKNKVCQMILIDIENMDSEIEQNILFLKYINGYTWEQICEIMNYSLRQIYYIHKQALQHFESVLTDKYLIMEGE